MEWLQRVISVLLLYGRRFIRRQNLEEKRKSSDLHARNVPGAALHMQKRKERESEIEFVVHVNHMQHILKHHIIDEDGRRLSSISGMQGVPMIASSPVRHESPMSNLSAVDVQTYQPPWKALSEFAMQPDIDTTAAPFQQLVNQMHGYDSGDPSGVPSSLSYLGPSDDSLTQPHSNMSQMVASPSEMSSPTSE
ncbi:Insulin protein enhancer protein ISL-2 [Nymphon striatum]|nr:Insulin protein enhancer protein ISL-2 [Nymphon striatum]